MLTVINSGWRNWSYSCFFLFYFFTMRLFSEHLKSCSLSYVVGLAQTHKNSKKKKPKHDYFSFIVTFCKGKKKQNTKPERFTSKNLHPWLLFIQKDRWDGRGNVPGLFRLISPIKGKRGNMRAYLNMESQCGSHSFSKESHSLSFFNPSSISTPPKSYQIFLQGRASSSTVTPWIIITFFIIYDFLKKNRNITELSGD